MKNFIQPGDVLDVTLAADVLSGGFVIAGKIAGVATKDGLSGEIVGVKTDGVWEFDKVSATVFTQGDTLYWDATNSELTKTASGNTKIGFAAKGAESAAATALVKLVATV